MDYSRSMERNWQLFKAKWHIPAGIPLGESYRISVPASEAARAYIPLPKGPEASENSGNGDHPSLAVVVPAAHSGPVDQSEMLHACLAQLERYRPKAHSVRVAVPGPVLRPPQLPGHLSVTFGNGTSLATTFQQATGSGVEHVLLLSSDVVLTEGVIDRLLAVARSDECIAAVGPGSNAAPSPQRVTPAYSGLDGPLTKFAARRAQKHQLGWTPVPYLGGFCLLLKSATVRTVGGWDPALPPPDALWDLFDRLRTAGYRLAYAKGAYVHHHALSADEGSGYDARSG